MNRHRAGATRNGGARSNGSYSMGSKGLQSNGLLFKAVVVATYEPFDGEAFPTDYLERATAIYCDVLTYSTRENVTGQLLERVMVCQQHGLHAGRIWKPRAAQTDIESGALSEDSSPENLDGDHVLVGFLDGTIDIPIILGQIPHPRLGEGNDALGVGHRERLKRIDGSPDLWKSRGTFHGVDDVGNFVVDTTRAHSGDYALGGAETPSVDSEHGNFLVKVSDAARMLLQAANAEGVAGSWEVEAQNGSITLWLRNADTKMVISNDAVTVHIAGVEALNISSNGPTSVLTVGGSSGTMHTVIAEQMQFFWETFRGTITNWMRVHQHTDPLSGITLPDPISVTLAEAAVPPWAEVIKSGRLKFPPG